MKIAVFLSGAYVRKYEEEELLNLAKHRDNLHFFIEKKK